MILIGRVVILLLQEEVVVVDSDFYIVVNLVRESVVCNVKLENSLLVDVRFNLWLIWDHIRLAKIFFNIADWLDRYLVSCLLENLLQPKPILVN